MNFEKKTAIEINNLTVSYAEKVILWNISLVINKGIFLAIVGPNGAGKTTFIKALLGLIKPVAGSIRIFEQDNSAQRGLIAYVPQRSTVDWDFPVTVHDVVLMGCYGRLGWFKRPSVIDKQNALGVLAHVGLAEYANTPISQLSGGQQQRVFLARALLQNPEIYILDEPFNGVDHHAEGVMVAILKQLTKQGKTVIAVHHDVQTLEDYFDWLLLLNGSCVAYGPTQSVLKPEYMCAVYNNKNIAKSIL